MASKPKKRMAAEDRRAQIVDVALKLFSEKGFSGTRTREIATRAGISEALIFRHFASKEELYNEALRETLKGHPMITDIIAQIEAGDDRGVLTAYAEHMVEHGLKDPRMFRLIIYSGLEGVRLDSHAGVHGEAGRETGEESGWEPSDAALVRYFRQRIEDGVFKPLDPEIMVRHFRNAVAMYVTDLILKIDPTPFPGSPGEAVSALVEIFLTGLQA